MPDHWRPYLREAALIRTCLHTGLNALARANHADTGLYAQAFFSVHAGLERLLKLIYVIDSALTHGGTLPTDEDLRRRFGHDLVPLFAMAADVRDRLEADGHAFRWGSSTPRWPAGSSAYWPSSARRVGTTTSTIWSAPSGPLVILWLLGQRRWAPTSSRTTHLEGRPLMPAWLTSHMGFLATGRVS